MPFNIQINRGYNGTPNEQVPISCAIQNESLAKMTWQRNPLRAAKGLPRQSFFFRSKDQKRKTNCRPICFLTGVNRTQKSACDTERWKRFSLSVQKQTNYVAHFKNWPGFCWRLLTKRKTKTKKWTCVMSSSMCPIEIVIPKRRFVAMLFV